MYNEGPNIKMRLTLCQSINTMNKNTSAIATTALGRRGGPNTRQVFSPVLQALANHAKPA